MPKTIEAIFTHEKSIKKIQEKLPILFHIAEEESKRDGKIGMEVGVLRERVIVSMFIHFLGEKQVCVDVPTTASELDVYAASVPISIKTITVSNKGSFSGVKASWTVDKFKARQFVQEYKPSCGLILTQINWSGEGGLYYVPLQVQQGVFQKTAKEDYFKLPKEGTNPRGIEYQPNTLRNLCKHQDSFCINITWEKPDIKVNVFERWVDLWND